ncbi:MAG: carboxypeptidase-like regulatory domain-containing protein [Planctomycetota bacterium]|nr:carboxypeptidase-like regulatory domain-containing protein [Planctomycetota bacterium]
MNGRVLVEGKAQEFIGVFIYEEKATTFSAPLVMVMTDDKGLFKIASLSVGKYKLEIQEEGFQKITKMIEVGANQDSIDLGDFELKKNVPLLVEFRVVDSFGADVSEFEIVAHKKGEPALFGRNEIMGKDGLAKVDDLEAGNLFLVVLSKTEEIIGFHECVVESGDVGVQRVNIQLTNKRGKFKGTIKDKAGKVVTHGFVVLSRPKIGTSLVLKNVSHGLFDFKDLIPGFYECEYLDKSLKAASVKFTVEIKDGEMVVKELTLN